MHTAPNFFWERDIHFGIKYIICGKFLGKEFSLRNFFFSIILRIHFWERDFNDGIKYTICGKTLHSPFWERDCHFGIKYADTYMMYDPNIYGTHTNTQTYGTLIFYIYKPIGASPQTQFINILILLLRQTQILVNIFLSW